MNKPNVFLSGRFFLCLLLTAVGLGFHPANAADSAKTLYEKSLTANVGELRGYYRKKLADLYPNTAYGLFARGWLADQNGDRETANRLYKQSVAKGHVATSYNNLNSNLNKKDNATREDKEAAANYRKLAMEYGIRNEDPLEDYFVYIYHSVRHQNMKSQREKQQLYIELGQSRRLTERLAGMQIRARDLQAEGRYEEALAVINDEDRHHTNKDLIDLELKIINKIGQQQRLSAKQTLSAMLSKRTYLEQTYSSDHWLLEYYYMRVHDYAKSLIKNRNLNLQLMQKAYSIRQSPGMLASLYSAMLVSDRGNIKSLLTDLERRFPDYAPVHSHWGSYYQYIELNPAKMFAANEKSIELAYSNKVKADYLKFTIEDALNFGLVNEADRLVNSQAKGLDIANAYYAQLDVALIQSQYQKARRLLTEAKNKNIKLDEYYDWLTQLGENNQQNLKNYAGNNPFLANWDREFSGSLSLAIEFPINSAVIPSSAYGALDKAARALKQPGGDKYIFRVEGHTDPSGGNKVNIPLSQRRAESVRRYLIDRHGIEPGRLQAMGMGDVQPVASNLTDTGRKRNRRVDIRPYGNISDPQLVTRGYLDTTSAVYSSDGRFMATGQSPITLWDTRYGVRLKELYMGGDRRRFSPNNRYLAAVSRATDMRGVYASAVYVTDIKTGHFAAIIPVSFVDSKGGDNLAWSPDSTKIAYTNKTGILSVYDLNKKKLVAATPMSDMRIAGQVEWTKDGRYIVTAQAQRRTLDIFDARTLTRVQSLSGVDWAHGTGLSDDGKVLLVANNNRTLTLYDTVNWRLIDNLQLPVAIPENIYAIPGTTKVVMDDKFSDKGIAIFDYQKRSWDLKTGVNDAARLGVSPDGEGIWVGSDHTSILMDRGNLKVERGFDSASDKARLGLSWDKSSDLLFVQDEAGVNIWHVSQARLVQRVQEDTIRWVQDTRDEKRWWTFTKSGELLSFSTNDYTVQRYGGVSFKPNFIDQEGDWLVVSEDVNDTGARSAKVAIFNLRNQRKESEFDVDLITAPLRHGNGVRRSGIYTMTVNPKLGLLALSTWWNDDFETTYSKNIQRFRLNDGSSMGDDVLSPSPIQGLDFAGMETGEIRVTAPVDTFILTLETGKYRDVKLKDWNEITLGKGKTLKYGSFFIEYNGIRRTLNDNIKDLEVDSERNVVVVQSSSNALTYYSLDTLEPRLFVYFKKNGEWLAADTHGYFTSSLNGTDNTYWSLGDNFLPFEALREKYENPRAVKGSLTALFNGQKPVDPKPIIEPDILDVPFDIAVVNAAASTTKDESYKLTLKITKKDKSVPDPTVYYLVNGRKSRGFDSDPFADLDETLTFVRTVPLSVGQNTIEAIVKYKDVDVAKKIVTVTREENRKAQLSKNTLWYFGVGVSEYAKTLQNLDFADRDALELEKAFKAQKGRLFSDVKTKVLTNGDATARDIKIQLYDFLSQAKPEDNVVIFIAGHGVQDHNQTLYYMPHDGDMKRPFTGMAMDDFKNFLDQRPINQKALFLMDICHAGAFDDTNNGRLSSEDVIKKLSSGTATTVFSSSTGAQQSLEDESFGGGHGAFTYAILQAIKGAADRKAGDEDGFVSLMEMIFFTKKEVARLTKKAQQPTVPVMGSFQDYPISASN